MTTISFWIDEDRRPSRLSRPHSCRFALLAAMAALARMASRLSKRWQERREYYELLALDDRMLKDIGIGRSEILSRVCRSD